MLFKLWIIFAFAINKVLGQTVCEPCTDSVCPNNGNSSCRCRDGYTGPTCQNKCPDNCESCDRSSENSCYPCKAGYYNAKISGQVITNCTLKCPDHCISCTSENYCSSCKDGFYNGPMMYIVYNDCSLSCYYGCKACETNDVCSECPNGFYGPLCQNNCSNGCISNICNKDNGSCDCKATYWGQNCSEKCNPQCNRCEKYEVCSECLNGFYGPSCQYNCSDGCKGNMCYKDNGNCDCKSTYWGENCENTCSKGCVFSTCFNETGECTSGCEVGYTGDMCNLCDTGFNKTNGMCTNCTDTCEKCEKGLCIKCKEKYGGIACQILCPDNCRSCVSKNMCTECIYGYFNETCSSICPENCLRDKTCSNNCTDNVCNGLTGECNKGCEDNYWGRSCENACRGNCKDVKGQSKCNDSNGNCLAGCIEGYYSVQCDKNCSINCLNSSCDNKGKCSHGCTGDYEDDLCLQVKFEQKQSIASFAATIGGLAGGAVALVIILIIIAVVISKIRQKAKGHMDKNNLINDAVHYSAEDESLRHTDSDSAAAVYSMPVKRTLRKEQDQSHTRNPNYQNSSVTKNTEDFATVCENTVIKNDLVDDPTTASPSKLSQKDLMPVSATRLSQEDLKSASATILSLKDRPSQSLKENVLELEDPDENAGSTSAALTPENGSHSTKSQLGDTFYTNEAVLKRKISVGKLAEFVDKNTKDCFEEEFKNLPAGLIKPYTESQKQDNITKNRYREVFPYDENRVVLKDGESDYINASFIDGYKKLESYIASLGPTSKYMQDMSAFWRMVWQEKCGKIVMLTNLLEAGARKCDQYWPEKDCSKLYADINVTCLTEEIYVEFTVRNFNIQKNSEERNVVQIHFTAWQDKGVPDDVISLIEFRQKVNSVKTNLDGPILVHCSAGIGRTGTYIALDILTQEGETEGIVDIYACVRNLREQRVNMVQTAEQYEYLHRAVIYSLTCDSHALDVTDFQRHMTTTGIETLAQQFQKLEHSVEKRSKDEEEAIVKNTALTEKNRIGADIPGDRNRPRLNLNLKPGACDYINAVYVNSYRRVNRYIVAQAPLQNTVVDFLTLVAQEKCSCVVSMEPETTKDGGVYFPADTHSWKRGSLIVRTEKVTSTQSFIHKRLKLSHHGKDPSEDHIVQHFQLTSWVEGKKCPDNAVNFLDFLHHVELKSGGAEAGPILVHCLTGAEKSGLFCVVAILLEKIQCDQQVSVVNTVRQVKSRRQRVIPNQEQYVFCHQCVNEYIQSFHIYSNFASRQ